MKKYKDAILSTVTGALFGLGIVAACVVSIKPSAEVKAVNIVHEIQKDARCEQAPVKSYTDEELELLALVIYQEAGGDACTDDTRLKVGTVVMNRVADHRFPDTLREVVLQRGQYGRLYWTGAEWPERANNEAEAHAVARAYDCAEQVLQGHRALPSDTVYQAEFEQSDEVVAHQDGFYFCRWEV